MLHGYNGMYVLYWCKTWPLTRRRNYRLRRSEEKKVQEDYTWTKRKKTTEEWRKYIMKSLVIYVSL
jgi:hypothetical protein